MPAVEYESGVSEVVDSVTT